MIFLIIVLLLLNIYLALRLFIVKKSIKELLKDFSDVIKNKEAEQHVQILAPDTDIEKLAGKMNEYVSYHFETSYEHQRKLKEVENEITNLSHDLRTPLTSILGYLDVMSTDNLSKDQKECIDIVKRRGRNLNDLIRQLYEYARAQNEEYFLDMQKLDIYRTIREYLLGYYFDFEKNNIDFKLTMPENPAPIYIMADKKRLNRVLTNLTSNAVKYCGGRLEVILNKEKLIYKTLRGDLTDNDIEHLFDRFYMKDEKRRDIIGSGLGLTITKLFVEQMGGRVCSYGDDVYLYIECIFKAK